ncbi:MAG: hypothetical protein LIP28_06275 [Deltaproteobacteria bacterium]|nr:hypothetical protein [Deltaproteobacteria bacterium]
MKPILRNAAVAAFLFSALAPAAAFATDAEPAPVTGLDYDTPLAPQVAPGPMGHVGPGDMLTTPTQRLRLEEERIERQNDPAAMDEQLDQTERELGLNGRR